jgi:hypothetical protein
MFAVGAGAKTNSSFWCIYCALSCCSKRIY